MMIAPQREVCVLTHTFACAMRDHDRTRSWTAILRRALAPTLVSLIGLSLASPASAWPLRHGAYRHVDAPPIVTVDCDVSSRNACYLQMNACFYRYTSFHYARRAPNFN